MLGELPESLTVGGKEYEINTDFRIALLIMEALNDEELSDIEKATVILMNLFCDEVEPEHYEEALKQASIFLDGGVNYNNEDDNETGNNKPKEKPVIDWVKDARFIFSAVNKVAGCEVRALPNLHWHTFLGYLSEMDECMLSTIINIRRKKNAGKKLDKTEQEFYKKNKDIIDIKPKLTREEKEQMEALKKKLGL